MKANRRSFLQTCFAAAAVLMTGGLALPRLEQGVAPATAEEAIGYWVTPAGAGGSLTIDALNSFAARLNADFWQSDTLIVSTQEFASVRSLLRGG